MSTQQKTDVDVAASGDSAGVRQAFNDYANRVRGGDVGSLPAILGLIALIILFSVLQHDVFFTILNFANLINQGAAIIVLAMGLVFVLLLGEIDLSAGYAAGTAAAILAVALTSWHWSWPLALIFALLVGTAIGLIIGLPSPASASRRSSSRWRCSLRCRASCCWSSATAAPSASRATRSWPS